jgi:hypothetical protein
MTTTYCTLLTVHACTGVPTARTVTLGATDGRGRRWHEYRCACGDTVFVTAAQLRRLNPDAVGLERLDKEETR